MQSNKKGYLGNFLLRAPGEEVTIAKEDYDHIQQEYIKCRDDPIYFAENYIKIVHVDKGFIPLKMYDYQKEITRKITDNRRVVVLTARQAGKTTTAVAAILHYVIFNEYKEVGILANKGAGAVEVLSRIKLAYEALPKWLQRGVLKWNGGDISLDNGCKIRTGTTTSSSIRGKSISFLYIDEAAFVEGYDEFFTSVYPTISSGDSTKLLLTSTPNGLNHFYKTFTGANKPIDDGWNGYHPIKVTWDMVPGRNEAWKQETLQALEFDMQKFSQEYEGEFLGSSGTLVNGSTLKAMVNKIPVKSTDDVSMYEEPQPDRIYTIIGDTSRGKGLDYNAAHVIDITEMPYRQACVYRNNFSSPIEYAEMLYQMSVAYNNAYVLLELNDLGHEVANLLLYEFEIETLFFTESAGRAGKKLSAGFSRSSDPGIYTSSSVKAKGCATLKLLLEQTQFIVNDFNTIEELSKFSKKGKSYEAESGSHDDLVMGLVLFGWLTTQPFFRELNSINTLEQLREHTRQEMENQMVVIGLHANDVEDDANEVEDANAVWKDFQSEPALQPNWRPHWMD